MQLSTDGVLIVVCLITLANLGILGLTIKLYTEILKDKSMDARNKKKESP